MRAEVLEGGFGAPARDAARAFRGALDAMARPGRIRGLRGARPPAPLSVAAGTLCLTLLDADTPLWRAPALRTPALGDWLTFHTGAPFTEMRGEAAFALGRWEDLLPLEGFALGTPDYPDRSATLIVEMDRLEPRGASLAGPGIDGTTALSLPMRERPAAFPLGLDLFLTAGDRVAGLPRSTRIG